MNGEELVSPEKASRMLKVTQRTLVNWANSEKLRSVRTKGNHRRFYLSDVIKLSTATPTTGKRICYCRVSTQGQKEDLNRQEEYFRHRYPDHDIIRDIGSGLNLKRKGFNSILEYAIRGAIEEIVVTHKDRLCRFGFAIIEKIIKQTSNGRIVVLYNKENSPEQELIDDLISIITCFTSRAYGLRSHKIKSAIKGAIEAENDEISSVSNGEREAST